MENLELLTVANEEIGILKDKIVKCKNKIQHYQVILYGVCKALHKGHKTRMIIENLLDGCEVFDQSGKHGSLLGV